MLLSRKDKVRGSKFRSKLQDDKRRPSQGGVCVCVCVMGGRQNVRLCYYILRAG